jgi:polyphosphate kinase
MMHRNLDRRIEALVHITDPQHIAQLDAQLTRGMSDKRQSWSLGATGSWERNSRDASGELLGDVQNDTMHDISSRKRGGVIA